MPSLALTLVLALTVPGLCESDRQDMLKQISDLTTRLNACEAKNGQSIEDSLSETGYTLVVPSLPQDTRLKFSKQINELTTRLNALETKSDRSDHRSNLIKGEDGWILAFKINAGVPSSYSRWNNIGKNDDDSFTLSLIPCGCTTVPMTPHCDRHYRSKVLDVWPSSAIDQVRVSVYDGGQQVAYMTFNGHGSTWNNWFSKERLLNSSWSDIATSTFNYFSLEGDDNLGRRFFINNYYAGCENDVGWLVVKDAADFCKWGTLPPYSAIIYSTTTSKMNYNSPNMGYADSLAVWILFKPSVDLTRTCLA